MEEVEAGEALGDPSGQDSHLQWPELEKEHDFLLSLLLVFE
jgi:hypothetical protein